MKRQSKKSITPRKKVKSQNKITSTTIFHKKSENSKNTIAQTKYQSEHFYKSESTNKKPKQRQSLKLQRHNKQTDRKIPQKGHLSTELNIPLLNQQFYKLQLSQIKNNSCSLLSKRKHIQNYNFIEIIGKGSVGTVWKVVQKKTNKQYALKQFSKAQVLAERNIYYIMNERQNLGKINFKFLVNMITAFQTEQKLYLILEYKSARDLRFHINFHKLYSTNKFQECHIRFFAACIILSLQYLHINQIVHKDLKPENLIFGNDGYLYLTDFGISVDLRENHQSSKNISGTIGYIAPQILKMQKLSQQVDYFSLGVILYELVFNIKPFKQSSIKQISLQFTIWQQKQSEKRQLIPKTKIPEHFSIQSIDFINKLLQIKPSKRLGYNGIQQIKNHPWLKQFPWKELMLKQLEIPYQFIIKNQNQFKFLHQEQEDFNFQIIDNQLLLNDGVLQQFFKGYTYHDNNQKLRADTTSPSYEMKRSTNQK